MNRLPVEQLPLFYLGVTKVNEKAPPAGGLRAAGSSPQLILVTPILLSVEGEMLWLMN